MPSDFNRAKHLTFCRRKTRKTYTFWKKCKINPKVYRKRKYGRMWVLLLPFSSYDSYVLNLYFLFVRLESKSGKIRSNTKYETKKLYIILLPTVLYCALAFYVRHFKWYDRELKSTNNRYKVITTVISFYGRVFKNTGKHFVSSKKIKKSVCLLGGRHCRELTFAYYREEQKKKSSFALLRAWKNNETALWI